MREVGIHEVGGDMEGEEGEVQEQRRASQTCQNGWSTSSGQPMRVAGFLSIRRATRSENSGLAPGMGLGSTFRMSCISCASVELMKGARPAAHSYSTPAHEKGSWTSTGSWRAEFVILYYIS